MRSLIVEDGLSRQALAAARALAADGWSVGVGSPDRNRCIAARSRAVGAWHPVPSPETSLAGFVEGVRAAVSAERYDVVFGARDFEVAALSYHRDAIEATVPYGPHDCVVKAQDKVELDAIGREAGFSVPAGTTDGAAALAQWPAPIVVKPRVGAALHRGLEAGRLPGRSEAVLARDRASVERAAETIKSAGDEPFFQEHLSGSLSALVVLADADSRLVACVQQRSERTWPADAGISVRARIVPVEEHLRECAQRLVSSLNWFGIAQLQLLVGSDGEPRLIDFNGRFYGSLALMLGGGINLPSAWGKLALGLPAPIDPAHVGSRYQWLWGDLRRAVSERHSGLARDVLDTLRQSPGATHSISSLRDPAPAARYLRMRLANLARRI